MSDTSSITSLPGQGGIVLSPLRAPAGFAGVGAGLPTGTPSSVYQVNRVPLLDVPKIASAPQVSGSLVAQGSTFTLIFSAPSQATVTAFTSVATSTTTQTSGSSYVIRAFAGTLTNFHAGTSIILTRGGIVILTFALADGRMVTGQVGVTTTQIGAFFQVECILTRNLVL